MLQPRNDDMGKFWKFQSDDKKAPQALVPSNVHVLKTFRYHTQVVHGLFQTLPPRHFALSK